MKKSLLKNLLLAIFVFALGMFIAGCNDVVKYKLQFVVDNEVYYTIDTAGNEAITLPQNPTKEGFVFDGWYWDNNVWQNPFTVNSLLNQPLSSDMKVYAKFNDAETLHGTEANFDSFTQIDNSTYSTKVDNNVEVLNFSNMVSISSKSTWTLCTDTYARESIPSKVATLQVGDNTYYILVTAQNGDVKLYTMNIRRLPMYSVTYQNSLGTQLESIQVQEEDKVGAIQLEEITGYTFAGWDYDFTQPIMQNTTITANYTANTYKIIYHSNTDEDEIVEQEVLFGDRYSIPEKLFTKLGYYISSWNTKQDGSGESQLGRNYRYNYDSDLHLYAQWQLENYRITYRSSTGQNDSRNPSSYTIESDDIILFDALDDNYVFLGWYTESEFINKVEVIPHGSTGNIDLYARWEDSVWFNEVTLTNSDFNSSTTTALQTSPTGWTPIGTSSGKNGIISVNSNNFSSRANSSYALQSSQNPYKAYTSLDDHILMINAKSSTTSNETNHIGYVSNSIQLQSNSYYRFSILTLTQDNAIASIYLKGIGDDSLNTSFEGYTKTIWTEYRFCIATGSYSFKVNLELWLGTKIQDSINAVFFDHITILKYSKTYFDSEAVQGERVNVIDLRDRNLSVEWNFISQLQFGKIELGTTIYLPIPKISTGCGYTVNYTGWAGASLNNEKFTPKKVGTYTLVYRLYDDNNNEVQEEEKSFEVVVEDTTSPEVSVEWTLYDSYYINTIVTLPVFAASDLSGINMELSKIEIKSNSYSKTIYANEMLNESNRKVTLSYNEQYTVTYMVYDKSGNITVKFFTINVTAIG